jgi:dTDP-glucose pyrophosphorylase
MQPTLVVLAAGIGSRYGGLKQIDPVGPSGEIVIDYSMYDALRAGFGKLVFVIRRDIDESFREVIGSKFEGKAEVAYVHQELDMVPDGFTVPATRKKPWGTAHAVMAAAPAVAGPFAVINADDFYGAESYRILHDFLAKADDGADVAGYALVGFILRNTLSEHGSVARGVCEHDEAFLLKSVVELTRIEKDGRGAFNTNDDGTTTAFTGDECVSMNMWGFTPSFFRHAERQFREFLETRGGEEKAEFFIPTVIDYLINGGLATVEVLPSAENWFGVTYPEDKDSVVASIRRLVDQGAYPENLWG